MKFKLYTNSLIILIFFLFPSCKPKSGRRNGQQHTQNNRKEQTMHPIIGSQDMNKNT